MGQGRERPCDGHLTSISELDSARPYCGTFLVARAGKVGLCQSGSASSEIFVPCAFSVVSPGTERWQLRISKGSETAVPLGYMAVSYSAEGEALLAPAPHGAMFDQNA